MPSPETLDCGHLSTPTEHTTGYARTRDDKRICYLCADEQQREEMKTATVYSGYLSSDGRAITSWTGGKLATITELWETSAGGFARHTTITRFRAVDHHGNRWYGTSPGRGRYARLHRAKGK